MKSLIQHLKKQIAAQELEIAEIKALTDADDTTCLNSNQEAALRAAEVAQETYEEILAFVQSQQAHEHLLLLRASSYSSGEPEEVEISGPYADDSARAQEITNAHAEWSDYEDSHARIDVLAVGRPTRTCQDGKWIIAGDIRSITFSSFDDRADLADGETRDLKSCKRHGVYRKIKGVRGCPYCAEARATQVEPKTREHTNA